MKRIASVPVTKFLAVPMTLAALGISGSALGQGTVFESQPAVPGRETVVTGQPAAQVGNDAMNLLLDQLQSLREEVQTLRGMVEEQGFAIRRMEREALDRYTDLDSRLTELSRTVPESSPVSPPRGQTSSPANNAGNNSGTGSNGNSTNQTPPGNLGNSPSLAEPTIPAAPASNASRAPARGTLEPAELSEQQLYQMAYESAINSQFDRSVAQFDQYLSLYRSGRFVTNAHYWKGQSYLYLQQYAEARQAYEIILEQYPNDPKAPDAMYGLALAYEGLGNVQQARQVLNDIKRQFPNTGVANLADTRLLSLQ